MPCARSRPTGGSPSPRDAISLQVQVQVQPGDVSWTGSAYNAENPAAPPPGFTSTWFCSTASENPCPPATGTDHPNVRKLTYVIGTLSVDMYTLSFQISAGNSNYTGGDVASVSFTTTNSGG